MSAVLSAVQSRPAEVEAVERELRVQLAAAYRLVEHFGWSELIYGHLTVRIPGETPTFPHQPLRVQLRGDHGLEPGADRRRRERGGGVEPPREPRRLRHPLRHPTWRTRSTNASLHTHTRAGMAAAALEDGLLQVHMYSTGFPHRIAYHEYEGPSLDLGERERLLADLGDCNAMILRNHGILTVGRTIPEAFIWLYRLERACQVQLDAMAAGRLHIIDPKVVEHSAKETTRFLESEAAVGELEFQALMRKLDRIDPSYRD